MYSTAIVVAPKVAVRASDLDSPKSEILQMFLPDLQASATQSVTSDCALTSPLVVLLQVTHHGNVHPGMPK